MPLRRLGQLVVRAVSIIALRKTASGIHCTHTVYTDVKSKRREIKGYLVDGLNTDQNKTLTLHQPLVAD